MANEAPKPNADIEITPAMIEAGRDVLYGFSTFFVDEETWAERVYIAMRKAANATAKRPE